MSNENLIAAVWEGKTNQKAQVMSAVMSENNARSDFAIVEGESPAAVNNGERSIVAYVSRSDSKPGVWVVSVEGLK